jgi:hypothetical protein
MHIISTRAALTRTQALSPAVGLEMAEIGIVLFIKHLSCHNFVSRRNPLAFGLNQGFSAKSNRSRYA